MEYCSNGSLDLYLKENHGFDEESCQQFLAQIILGLEVLHDHNVIHRV